MYIHTHCKITYKMRGITWLMDKLSHHQAGLCSISQWVYKTAPFTTSQTFYSGLGAVAIKQKADTIRIRVIAMLHPAFYKKDFIKDSQAKAESNIFFKIWKGSWKYLLNATKSRNLVGFTQLPTATELRVWRRRREADNGLPFNATIKISARSKLDQYSETNWFFASLFIKSLSGR
jgi:hypothetical protein